MLWNVRNLLVLSVLLGSSVALAADPDRDSAKDSPSTAKAQGEGFVEHVLVTCLIRENENEIAVARFAQKQASDKDVQSFAEKMVKDHSAFLTKLAKFRGRTAGAAARDIRDNERDRKADTKAEAKEEGKVSPDRGLHSTSGTMMQIHDELARQCLKTTLRELGHKPPSEFDRCYMGTQIHAHLKMADMLEVYKKHCGSELREVLTEAAETTQEHLTMAKKIAKELESGSATETTSKEKGR